ncbi:MAG: PIN domain-containing protein [Fulvimarina manganoxydans]|uniref:type II toxin-antitoxin system VapC family toxin n=1 Tax=Fulvimarina manganoxydans TaxID=937218 RepID=UPI002356265C|nr:PIN domain-containing protein [Fulvimarina manganoxydans]MCK5930752.1 PIN domain-containing protein [Fulvimarina manganoxydans]
MILVDTSAWIEYFSDRGSGPGDRVFAALLHEQIVVGDLVLVEQLRGIRLEREIRLVLAKLAGLPRRAMCSAELAELAAANYRIPRRHGLTIRGTIDVVFATWCIVNKVPIIHHDKDMGEMERELGLLAYWPEA